MVSYTKEYINPIIYNPEERVVCEDNPVKKINEAYQYGNRILNAKRYIEIKKANNSSDPLKIVDVFYNNGGNANYADQANEYFSQLQNVQVTKDESAASAIISSKEYTVLQDSVILGQNEEIIKTGILVGLFEEVQTPNLTGKWLDWANDVKYFTNIAESKSPEPTLGSASTINIEVPKHGGAISITDRARQVINGADVFSRLVNQLQQRRLASENELVAEEIETATTVLSGGVDFGGSTNPADTWSAINAYFDGTVGTFNLFLSNAVNFTEYLFNTRVSPITNPIQGYGSQNEQVSSVQGLPPSAVWARDNFFDDDTKGWAMDRSALKIFRGPTRAYTVTDPDTETEKYVTKTHMLPKIVNSALIRRIDGIQA